MDNSRIIISNGVYDVIHRGHVRLLEYARSLGNKLIVAIDSDSRVKTLKGANRPINNSYNRRKVLEAIRYVDMVVEFDSEEELIAIIKDLDNPIMVKGDEYKNKRIVGSEYCSDIKFVEKDSLSTTATINHPSYR
jgi:D-beta-D-heptose 7-phosphate kinase/D-beta-D-heptose 1-phosphate adenosyltransferase